MAYPGEINNFEPWEGELNGTFLISFVNRPRLLVIANDSTTATLEFRFNTESEDWGTIKPTETIHLDVGPNQVQLLSAVDLDYRVWGFF